MPVIRWYKCEPQKGKQPGISGANPIERNLEPPDVGCYDQNDKAPGGFFMGLARTAEVLRLADPAAAATLADKAAVREIGRVIPV